MSARWSKLGHEHIYSWHTTNTAFRSVELALVSASIPEERDLIVHLKIADIYVILFSRYDKAVENIMPIFHIARKTALV